MDNQEIKKCIEDWLSLPAHTKRFNCPFWKYAYCGAFRWEKLHGRALGNIVCNKYFKHLDKYYLIDPCPCSKFSLAYVRKRAHLIIRDIDNGCPRWEK